MMGKEEICSYIKHIWYRKGIERKCIVCNKEQVNVVKVVNEIGKLHGGYFKLHDDWRDA